MAVLAKSYARLGWQNLVNFGIVPFEFAHPEDYDTIEQDDVIRLEDLAENFKQGKIHYAVNETKDKKYELKHSLSERQIKVIIAGGVINYFKMSSDDAISLINMSDV